MLYKLINEHSIQRFNGWWKVNNTIVTNADAEALALSSGEWYPLIEDELPTYNPETQYLDYTYVQEADAIRKVYMVVDIPIDDITLDEYNSALQTVADYENQIKDAFDEEGGTLNG